MVTSENSEPLNVTLGTSSEFREVDDLVVLSRKIGETYIQKMSMSFQRTVRVADNNRKNSLPPSLGSFPIYRTEDYQELASSHLRGKSGYFIPMYQREAMWINFTSDRKFAVKIYVGGVNAVSGEPARETEATMMRRLKLVENKQSIQDYIVTPDQLWLDGIASAEGVVRQFVAMPLGAGYTVEAQVTCEEVIGGLQIEVTPSKFKPVLRNFKMNPKLPNFELIVRDIIGIEYHLEVSAPQEIANIKSLVQDLGGIPPAEQWLHYAGKQLIDSHTLGDYNMKSGAVTHLHKRLRGGGGGQQSGADMGIAAGGLIRQTILKDRYNPIIWEPECGTIFNVQILNSARFHEITGMDPPSTPVSAAAYAKHGYPYFEMFNEEASGITGDFEGVKSVNEMDIEGKPSMEKAKAVTEVIKSTDNKIVLLDENGKHIGFRTVDQMEKAVRDRFAGMHI